MYASYFVGAIKQVGWCPGTTWSKRLSSVLFILSMHSDNSHVALRVFNQIRKPLLHQFPVFTQLFFMSLFSSAFREDSNWYGQCQLIIDLVIICFPLRPRQLIHSLVRASVICYLWLTQLCWIDLFTPPAAFSTQQTFKDKYLLSPGRAERSSECEIIWWLTGYSAVKYQLLQQSIFVFSALLPQREAFHILNKVNNNCNFCFHF